MTLVVVVVVAAATLEIYYVAVKCEPRVAVAVAANDRINHTSVHSRVFVRFYPRSDTQSRAIPSAFVRGLLGNEGARERIALIDSQVRPTTMPPTTTTS